MREEPTSLRSDDPGVRALFTEAARFQSWLDVEAARAQVQAELGIIPESAAREISRKAHLKHLDLGAVRSGLAKTGHPLVPMVWELDRVCENGAGGYVHWGATTQNITQTGQLLQVRRAHDIFLRQLAAILTTLADLAEKTKDVLIPGRTHGQHAVPATFGFKVAVWIDELCRHVERLRGCEHRVFVAMLGGGAGTLASLGELGRATQEKMAARLGMRAMTVPARTIGDHQAEYVLLLGMLAATASKMARELTGDMLQRMIVLFDGLQIFPERMRENLDLSGGLIMAEALMLELGRQIGRQRAHDVVYEAAQASVTQARPFKEMLAKDPHV